MALPPPRLSILLKTFPKISDNIPVFKSKSATRFWCFDLLEYLAFSETVQGSRQDTIQSCSQPQSLYLRMFPRPRLSMLLVLSPAEARPRPSISSCCMGRHWRRERQVRHVRAPSPLMVMTRMWLVRPLYWLSVMTVNTGLAATYLRKHLISLSAIDIL